MASSAVSSVIGSPLRTGSCLGFLSAAALAAGISTPKERKVLKERKHARRARGVSRMGTRMPREVSLKRWCGDSSITPRLTLRGDKSCWEKGWCGLRMAEKRRDQLRTSAQGLVVGLGPQKRKLRFRTQKVNWRR